MNVLSLFDGISCGQIALNRAGVDYEYYYASEIDKHSIGVTQTNFPNTIQVGNVLALKAKDLPTIDLLIGGSPCQGFSFAGKQLNFEDPRSKLFFEYARLLKELKPKHFLLENVRMKKISQDVISKELGVEPIEINSSLVSAQNRRRLYWTNIPNITQPIDKNIQLIDILENGNITPVNISEQQKIEALTKSYGQKVFAKNGKIFIKAKNHKSIQIDLSKEVPYTFYETRTEEGKRIRREIRKSTGLDSTPRTKEHKMYLPQVSGKANCLVTIESPLDYVIDTEWNYRKLSVLEQERMQTVPDNYTVSASESQRRKALGNGWTVDVIAHILKNIKTK